MRERTREELDEMQARFEELKAEYAAQRGWDIDEDGDYFPYWWEDDDKLYACECYAYDILEKEFPL